MLTKLPQSSVCTSMNVFPDTIQRVIWQTYFSAHVLPLINGVDPVSATARSIASCWHCYDVRDHVKDYILSINVPRTENEYYDTWVIESMYCALERSTNGGALRALYDTEANKMHLERFLNIMHTFVESRVHLVQPVPCDVCKTQPCEQCDMRAREVAILQQRCLGHNPVCC